MPPDRTNQEPPPPSLSSLDIDHLRRVPRVVPLLALGLAVALAAWFLAVPRVYRAYKSSRGERVARVALAAIDRGDWEEASQNALLAIRLAPQNPLALRAAANMATLTGNPKALHFWTLLFERTTPTREDRLAYTRLALRIRRPDLARAQLTVLLRENRHDPEAMALGLAALMEEGRPKDALVAAPALADEYPDRPGTELQLSRALMAVGGSENQRQALHLLWNLAFGSKPDAFAAVAELSRMPGLSPGELRMLARRAPGTQTNALFRLLVDHNVRLRLDPNTDRIAAAKAVVSSIGIHSPVDERIVAIDWILANAPATHALELASAPWCLTNTPVLERRLQAFALLDRWNDISAQIEDADTAIDPVSRDLYRAIVATHQKRPDEAARHLASAARRSGDDPGPLQMVAAYAESLDQPRVAAEALHPLLGNPALAPTAAPRVLGLLKRVDEIGPMSRALERLLAFDPSNTALRNEQIWLRLLASERTAENQRAAQRLVDEEPDNPRYLASAALAWYRLDDPGKALELMEAHQFGDTNAPVRNRLVHCAALGATGRRDAAHRLARQIPLAGLRSEERLLIQRWLDPAQAP